MKVLFAVRDENITNSIISEYQKQYGEIITSKNVYYFDAITMELQRDKTYDRVVMSEDLEPVMSNNYDEIDKTLFDKLDNITDEAATSTGDNIPVILIMADRRRQSEDFIIKIFSIGVFNGLLGQDRSTTKVCDLIARPRTKKEAKVYYAVDSDQVTYSKQGDNDVSEAEIQNIINYYRKIEGNESKYTTAFNNIASQYNDDQLKVIITFLPASIRSVLELKSAKYQQIAQAAGIQPIGGSNVGPVIPGSKNSLLTSNENGNFANIQSQNGVLVSELSNNGETSNSVKNVVIPTAHSIDNVKKMEDIQPQMGMQQQMQPQVQQSFQQPMQPMQPIQPMQPMQPMQTMQQPFMDNSINNNPMQNNMFANQNQSQNQNNNFQSQINMMPNNGIPNNGMMNNVNDINSNINNDINNSNDNSNQQGRPIIPQTKNIQPPIARINQEKLTVPSDTKNETIMPKPEEEQQEISVLPQEETTNISGDVQQNNINQTQEGQQISMPGVSPKGNNQVDALNKLAQLILQKQKDSKQEKPIVEENKNKVNENGNILPMSETEVMGNDVVIPGLMDNSVGGNSEMINAENGDGITEVVEPKNNTEVPENIEQSKPNIIKEGEAPKRGRGRPRKNPIQEETEIKDDTQKRKRGRPPKNGNASNENSENIREAINKVQQLLSSNDSKDKNEIPKEDFEKISWNYDNYEKENQIGNFENNIVNDQPDFVQNGNEVVFNQNNNYQNINDVNDINGINNINNINNLNKINNYGDLNNYNNMGYNNQNPENGGINNRKNNMHRFSKQEIQIGNKEVTLRNGNLYTYSNLTNFNYDNNGNNIGVNTNGDVNTNYNINNQDGFNNINQNNNNYINQGLDSNMGYNLNNPNMNFNVNNGYGYNVNNNHPDYVNQFQDFKSQNEMQNMNMAGSIETTTSTKRKVNNNNVLDELMNQNIQYKPQQPQASIMDVDFGEENDDELIDILEVNTDYSNPSGKIMPKEHERSRRRSSNKPKFDMTNLDRLKTKGKKIVSFIGSPKNGTSFLVNNIADMVSRQGIKTAILDCTKNRNSYFIYTKNEEELRLMASEAVPKLATGYVQGIKVNSNLDVYVSIPGEDNGIENYEPILSTLLNNYALILLDCDFTSNYGYLVASNEIYLVQNMDILTIQPLTRYLKDMQAKGILDTSKLRIVINKYVKTRGLGEKKLIGGMSGYSDPSMSYMTSLFDPNKIKYCVVPFSIDVYSKYLAGLVENEVFTGSYQSDFVTVLRKLSNMVYPINPVMNKFGNYKKTKL